MKGTRGKQLMSHSSIYILRKLVEMCLGDTLHLIMVLDDAKIAVVTHKTEKKIMGTIEK